MICNMKHSSVMISMQTFCSSIFSSHFPFSTFHLITCDLTETILSQQSTLYVWLESENVGSITSAYKLRNIPDILHVPIKSVFVVHETDHE